MVDLTIYDLEGTAVVMMVLMATINIGINVCSVHHMYTTCTPHQFTPTKYTLIGPGYSIATTQKSSS